MTHGAMLQTDTSTLVLDQTRSMGYGMHASAVGYDSLDVASSILQGSAVWMQHLAVMHVT